MPPRRGFAAIGHPAFFKEGLYNGELWACAAYVGTLDLGTGGANMLQIARILVVEDNYLLADEVCDSLAEFGMAFVGPAATVAEGYALARDAALDGAILDVNLDGRMCFPICTALVQRKIPFLFLTGYRELTLVPPEFQSAATVSKPFDPASLKCSLDAMLRRSIGTGPAPEPMLHAKGIAT